MPSLSMSRLQGVTRNRRRARRKNLRGRRCLRGRTLGQLPIHQEEPAGRALHQLQLLHDLVRRGLFFHLLGNEPLQKSVAGVVLFVDRHGREIVDAGADVTLVGIGVFKYTQRRLPVYPGRLHRFENYAPAAIEHIVQTAQLTADSVVADIGAGTGMLGEHFLGRAGRVFAIEPNPEMRQAALFEMVDGRSDATTLPDGSVDLIAVGRAIHWFPFESTKAEFWRILKPAGFLAVLRIPCADENLLSALNAIKTEENGWNRELYEIRRQQPPLEFYFGHGDFQRLRFPASVRESWEEFFGRLCSFAVAPTPSHPRFAAFQQAAHEVFDRFRSGEFLTVPLATELFLGRITQDDPGLFSTHHTP